MLTNILIATGVLTAIAIVMALLLSLSSKYLSVDDNNKDEQIDKIEFYLPSYNCGACGNINCRQVAKKIVDGKIDDVKICKVISEDNANLIREYCKQNNINIK